MRFTYETKENSSYVVATISSKENVDNNQLQILSDNDIINIINPDCKFLDNEIILSYNITSKISLAQATAKKKIHKNGFINLIEGAVSAIEDMEKYGLVTSGLVFDENNIYVKAGTYEPSFVYLPYISQDSGIQPLKQFILSLITSSKIERLNDNFIQILFDTLNNPNLCVNDLRELCNEQTKGRMSAAKLTKNARFSVITPTMIDSESEILKSIYKKPKSPNDKLNEALQENTSDKENKKQSAVKTKINKYIFMLLQLFLIVIIVIISKSGFFGNADGTLNIKYLLLVVVGLCVVDFVICKELFTNGKTVNDEESAISNKVSDSSSLKNSLPTDEKKTPDSTASHLAPSPIHDAPKSLEQIYAGAQGSEFDDTVLLDNENSCAYLEFYEKGVYRKINLDNDVITVGKLSSLCDYSINNNKISKIHAQFIVRGNDYFVKDCNSTNGIYINGSTQRIASNEEYQIYDGYRITLANVELTFKCL